MMYSNGLSHARFEPNGHLEDAPHLRLKFKLKTLTDSPYFLNKAFEFRFVFFCGFNTFANFISKAYLFGMFFYFFKLD